MAATIPLHLQYQDTNGSPLEGGYLYFGTAGQNPITNPITVYWDAGLTQPAAQPIRTVNGYPSRSGNIANIFCAVNYSLLVKNSNLDTVYSELTSANSFFGTIMSLASSAGASLIGFIQAGTGAILRTLQDKFRTELISVLDFGADPTGVADSTTAFTNAQGSGNRRILVPAGTYLVNNLRYKAGVVFEGDGYSSTIIKQGVAGSPAIYALSDVTTGQLVSIGLKNLRVEGHATATVAAVKVEATTPYVVSFSDFDYHAYSVYRALEIVCTAANEVYSNKFNVFSVGSSSDSFITKGAYNEYRFEAVLCATGTRGVSDTSIDSSFIYCVADGTLEFGGQNCLILNPAVETIYGATSYDDCAFRVVGYNNTLISPTVTEVATAKASYSFRILNKNTFINPVVWGVNYPAYPFTVTFSPVPTIIGGTISCTNKLEQYSTAADFSRFTLVGDTTSFSLQRPRYGSAITAVAAAAYTVDASITTVGLDEVLMVNNAGTCTLTLPSDAAFTGRTLRISTRTANAVVSASANVVPLTGPAGTAILAATAGKWALLQYDGTNWNVLENN